jgi:hypothetical protein
MVSILFSIATFVFVRWRRRQHCAVAAEFVAVALRFVRQKDDGEGATAEAADAMVGGRHYYVIIAPAQCRRTKCS